MTDRRPGPVAHSVVRCRSRFRLARNASPGEPSSRGTGRAPLAARTVRRGAHRPARRERHSPPGLTSTRVLGRPMTSCCAERPAKREPRPYGGLLASSASMNAGLRTAPTPDRVPGSRWAQLRAAGRCPSPSRPSTDRCGSPAPMSARRAGSSIVREVAVRSVLLVGHRTISPARRRVVSPFRAIPDGTTGAQATFFRARG